MMDLFLLSWWVLHWPPEPWMARCVRVDTAFVCDFGVMREFCIFKRPIRLK